MILLRVTEFALLSLGAIVASTAGYALLFKDANPALPHKLSVHELGSLEGRLAHLRRVIVVCNEVQRPQNALATAVEHNFAKGVRYTFLVPESRENDERNGYFKIFEALATVALKKSSDSKTLDDLVEILKLPTEWGDWNDYPYVFYQIWNERTNKWRATVAYRGDKLRKGIAPNYVRVPPAFAHTIARSILSRAPTRFATDKAADISKFVSNVIQLKRA